MNARIYLLLEIRDGHLVSVTQSLKSQQGVARVESLEGKPNMLVSLEGANNRELARSLIPVIKTIEHVTEDFKLLIPQNNDVPCSLAQLVY